MFQLSAKCDILSLVMDGFRQYRGCLGIIFYNRFAQLFSWLLKAWDSIFKKSSECFLFLRYLYQQEELIFVNSINKQEYRFWCGLNTVKNRNIIIINYDGTVGAEDKRLTFCSTVRGFEAGTQQILGQLQVFVPGLYVNYLYDLGEIILWG